MSGLAESAALRERAAGLRRVADEILGCPVMELLSSAGTETWDSPRAEACRHQLRVQIAAAHQAVDELLGIARRLEDQAQKIEYALALEIASLTGGTVDRHPRSAHQPARPAAP